MKPLHRLLSQMRKVDAGSPFDVVIVCNGGDKAPLLLPPKFDDLRPRIFNRENQGYNIGAWDHGWKNAGDYDYFLFIQDDCFLKARYWVSRFENRFDKDLGIGLLGEHIMYDQMSWEYVRTWTYSAFWGPPETWSEPAHPIERYKELFATRGIPAGETAKHLPSIVLFSSRAVLEEIGGFPYYGLSYREAVASEYSISKLVESKGYRISRVTDHSFELVGHPQWTATGKIRSPGLRARLFELIWKTKAQFRMFLGHKNRAQRLGVALRPLVADPLTSSG